jgi:hypothetical protein
VRFIGFLSRTNNDDTPTVIQIGTGGSEWALKAYNNLNPDDYGASSSGPVVLLLSYSD